MNNRFGTSWSRHCDVTSQEHASLYEFLLEYASEGSGGLCGHVSPPPCFFGRPGEAGETGTAGQRFGEQRGP